MSNINKALEHEWFVQYIDRSRFDLTFAMINGKGSAMDSFLKDHAIPVYHFQYNGKANMIKITWKLFRLLKQLRPDIVHTHLFEANLCGMTAAVMAGIKTRIVTRHHSDYHHTWYPHAVIYDRYVNFLATQIIAISRIVKEILVDWEKVNPGKVQLLHHGLETDLFMPSMALDERIQSIKARYNLPREGIIIGVISRFIEWKGVQYIIPAFQTLLNKYPRLHLLLANASGNYEKEITVLLKTLPVEAYTLIKFENDLPALFGTFDIFVHVPVSRESEAFGQVYIEALMSKTPSVFTLSGIAADVARHGLNCLVVPYRDEFAISNAVEYLVEHPEKAEKMAYAGYEDVKDIFSVKIKIERLQQIYLNALS